MLAVLAFVLAACSGNVDLSAPGSEPESPGITAVAPTPTTSTAAPEQDPPPEETSSAANDAPVPAATTCRGQGNQFTVGRTDIDPTGNRNAPGGIDLLAAPRKTADLPATPTWIVPFFAPDAPCEPHWYVTLADGQAVIVDPTGAVAAAGDATVPPQSAPGLVSNAYDSLDQFENPLPDSRVVSFGRWSAALVDPTDRYGHGVLGDRIEAGAVEVIDNTSGDRTRIVIDEPTVIEGISPMLIDVDQTNDATPEVLVTLSNGDVGAWLALYDIDGNLRAQSAPIGRGNRWRNQLGAGWIGAGGDYLIVDVRTPHLDGIVEFFRVNGDELERTASISGYTNHTIGSRNLDLGILVDADADKLDEVVLPTRDLQALAIIDRQGNDAVEAGRIDLGGSLNTNIATQWLVGQAWLAVGTDDGRLLVFGDPAATSE